MRTFLSSLFNLGQGMSRETGHRVASVCQGLLSLSLLALAFGLPLFFLPGTSEVLEFNKQTYLFIFSVIALISWLGKILALRKAEFRHSVINVMVGLFAAVYIISALASQSRAVSFLGDASQAKAGLLTVLCFTALYFVIVNNVREMSFVRKLLGATILGGFLAALFAMLQGMGYYVMPFDFTKTGSFTTVGTSAALAVYLSFIVTVAGGLLLAPHGAHECAGWKCRATNGILFVGSLLPLFLIAVVDFWPVLTSLAIGSAVLVLFAILHANVVRGVRGIALPLAAFVVTLFLLVLRFPVQLGFPAEVMPSLKASTQITYSVLRDRPLFGSGPSTYLYDYAKYHSTEVNSTDFWNVRFDRSASRALTLAATTGLFGILTYLLLVAFVFFAAFRAFLRRDEETWHTMIGVFAGWCMLVASRFIYSSNITLEFLFWFATALLVVTIAPKVKVMTFEEAPRVGILASFFLILTSVTALACAFIFAQRYLAETSYAYAFILARQPNSGEAVVNQLAKAVGYQGSNDMYLRNLASARLEQAIANGKVAPALTKEEGETEAQFKERQQKALNDQDAKTIAYASDAVTRALQATQVNPANITNWALLASVYQNIMGVTTGADERAVASYQQAISLEPNNPVLHTELGKVYLYQADVLRNRAGETKDETDKKQATESANELLTKAVDAFNKAIELKSDYAEAHYNLALALDRQDRLKDAISKMESVVALKPRDVGVGFQLALLYYRDDRKDAAIRLMESVVRLSPTFANARWYLAAMYQEKGDYDAALAQLHELEKLDPENTDVKAKIIEVEAKKAAPGELPKPVGDSGLKNTNDPVK